MLQCVIRTRNACDTWGSMGVIPTLSLEQMQYSTSARAALARNAAGSHLYRETILQDLPHQVSRCSIPHTENDRSAASLCDKAAEILRKRKKTGHLNGHFTSGNVPRRHGAPSSVWEPCHFTAGVLHAFALKPCLVPPRRLRRVKIALHVEKYRGARLGRGERRGYLKGVHQGDI